MGSRDRKVLAGMVVVGLLAVVAVWGQRVHARRTARALRAEAAEAGHNQKYEQAERALSRYLTLRPDDKDAFADHVAVRERLARTNKDWLKVLDGYERVVRSDPARPGSRRRLAEIALGLGRYRDAENHLAVLCGATRDDGALEFLRGRALEGLGDFRSAAAWYEKARMHDPERLDAPVRLAGLLRDKLADPDRADRVIDAMVASNPGSSRAWVFRARYRGLLHQPGQGDDLEKALTLAPDDRELMIERARSLRGSGDFDRARRLLVKAQQADPNDPRTYEEVAEVELGAGRIAGAVAELRRGVVRMPDRPGLRWLLAHLLAQVGSTKELAGHIKTLREARQPSGPIDYLEAWLCVNRADWPGATRALDRVGTSCDDRPELQARVYYLRGLCLGHDGAIDRQVAALRRAVQLQPRWSLGRRALASALLNQGDPDEAESYYRREVEDGGGNPATLNNLAWLRAIRGGDAAGALALINKAIALAGRRPDLLDTRGVVFTALGRTDSALSDLKESAAARPSSLTYLHIAQAYLKGNDRAAATEAVRRAELAGLDPGRLHPLERAAYDRFLAAIRRP